MYNDRKISKFPPPWNFKFTFECVQRYEDNKITTPMERQIHLECVQWLEDIKIPDPIDLECVQWQWKSYTNSHLMAFEFDIECVQW